MRLNILLLIFAMGAVTYASRSLPGLLIDKMNFSPRAEQFLKLIPYTAMTALIFPGILTVDPVRPEIGIVGALVVIVLAWKKAPLLVCVVGAILTDMMLYLMF